MPLSGELSFDPALPLVEVIANVYQGEEPIAAATLLDLPSWQIGEGAFSAVMNLPANLPTGVYTVTVEASDGSRRISSEPQTFAYRVPRLPQVSIDSPVSGSTYYSAVNIEGAFSVDPALAADISAVLQPVDGEQQELPLAVEGESFSALITEPGAYRLLVTVSDGRVDVQDVVDFEFVTPLIDVLVEHDYPIGDDGFIETFGDFRFTANIEANITPQPETFVLEQQVSGVWLPLAEFAADEVWSAEEQTATIAYDFIDSTYGFNNYRLRVRAELQDGLSGVSDQFSVRYRPVAPTLTIDSPVATNTYYRDVIVSGSATWDRRRRNDRRARTRGRSRDRSSPRCR